MWMKTGGIRMMKGWQKTYGIGNCYSVFLYSLSLTHTVCKFHLYKRIHTHSTSDTLRKLLAKVQSYIFITLSSISAIIFLLYLTLCAPLLMGFRICWLYPLQGDKIPYLSPKKEYLRHDIKLDLMVRLQFWRVCSTPSLPLLSGPLSVRAC